MEHHTHFFMTMVFGIIFLCAGTFIPPAHAGEVQVKGIGSARFSTRTPAPNDILKAGNIAGQDAWQRYTSRFNSARMRRYESIKDDFLTRLNQYITRIIRIEKTINQNTKTVTVVARATINETAVNEKFRSLSSAGQQDTGRGSVFEGVFMTRKASSTTSYDPAFTKISEFGKSNGQSGTLKSYTRVGGSKTQKSDKTIYEVSSAWNLAQAMTEILSSYGFESVDYDDVVSECGGAEPTTIANEFSQSDKISRTVRKSMIDAAKRCEVSLFALGTLDVGAHDIDPVSGNDRVYVTARGTVWSLKKRLPLRVASVKPIISFGLGSNEKVATVNALNIAATRAARSIVDQLNAKGIH